MRQIPSLQSLCINKVVQYIEDVDALFGIGGQNMDAISKSLSKNRRLDSHTVKLFLQSGARKLSFYDCSKLDSEVLASIPRFCPFVQDINLQLCGMMDNAVLDSWSEKLKELKSIELYGPFLVRIEAWHRFFENIGPRLNSFKIRDTPRFDKGCCEMLVKHCPNVTNLGLAQVGQLNAECLQVIKAYGTQLTYLDISDPGVSAPGIPPQSLKDEEVVDLLRQVGPSLTYLDVSRNADLSCATIVDGILAHCTSLKTVRLALLQNESLEAEHFITLFRGWKGKNAAKLECLSLERCLSVNDDVVDALVEHCGPSLVDLNVNSCDLITEAGFKRIAEGCPNLTRLDVGFCRSIRDDIVTHFIAHMPRLTEISLFSCNKIRYVPLLLLRLSLKPPYSPFLTSDRVRILGKEKYPVI